MISKARRERSLLLSEGESHGLPVVWKLSVSPKSSCARSVVFSVVRLEDTGPLRGGNSWEVLRSLSYCPQKELI